MVILDGLLVCTLLLLGYVWLGFAPLVAVASRLFGHRNGDPAAVPDEHLPAVHIICSAYNEVDVIESRLRNIESLDYPSERVHVYVGTDGCADDTAARARPFCERPNWHLHELAENRGKPAVLKDLVARAMQDEAPGEDLVPPNSDSRPPTSLLVFTDANTMFRADALRKLVRHFVDPGIGGVCGRLVFVKPGEENPEAEGAYWGFETKLKTWESSLDSCLGANGAVYAIRPELFWNALPPNTVVDDFVIGMKVREKGYRMVYDPTAVAEEELPEQRAEWKRRVRIGSGDYQAISFCRRCLHPSYGWLAWAFWSHKVLRWFTPHLMLLAAIAAVIGSVIALLTDQPAPLSHLVSAGALIMLSLWGVARILSSVRPSISGLRLPCTAHRAKERPPTSDFRLPAVGALLRLLDHFLTMQAALLAGFFRYLGGGMSGTWVRTPR